MSQSGTQTRPYILFTTDGNLLECFSKERKENGCNIQKRIKKQLGLVEEKWLEKSSWGSYCNVESTESSSQHGLWATFRRHSGSTTKEIILEKLNSSLIVQGKSTTARESSLLGVCCFHEYCYNAQQIPSLHREQ